MSPLSGCHCLCVFVRQKKRRRARAGLRRARMLCACVKLQKQQRAQGFKNPDCFWGIIRHNAGLYQKACCNETRLPWVRPFKYPDLPRQQMELERRVKEHSRDSAGESERGEKEMAWEEKWSEEERGRETE